MINDFISANERCFRMSQKTKEKIKTVFLAVGLFFLYVLILMICSK